MHNTETALARTHSQVYICRLLLIYFQFHEFTYVDLRVSKHTYIHIHSYTIYDLVISEGVENNYVAFTFLLATCSKQLVRQCILLQKYFIIMISKLPAYTSMV